MQRAAAILLSVALLAIVASASLDAQAQGTPGLGDPSGTLPQQPGTQQGKAPETHAAAGAEATAQLPTEEAQLPEKPNEIPRQLKSILGSDAPRDYEKGRLRETTRSFWGPYYEETSGSYSFRTIFPPLWMEREQQDDRASLIGLSYYQRRSKDIDADVLFPIFWKLRDEQTYTTIAGPWMHRESPVGHDNWLAPLYFEGTGADGKAYLHIPPLLTFHTRTARQGFSMAGPLYCSWKGGARCDSRTADEIDYGIAPLYFYHRDDRKEQEIIPPLLHYYRYAERGDSSLNVWGPFWMEKDRNGGVFNILPLFWHNWTANSENTTLFPLFHYGHEGTASTIATPLFVHHTDDSGAKTFATLIYSQHRGRTQMEMYTPLLWHYEDPDVQLNRWLAFPFVYYNESNRSSDLALFPLYANFERFGIYNETWITPLFRHRTDLTGWETDILPFFFMGRENNSTHLVVAPLLFDFASPNERSTVIAPLFWRFTDTKHTYQLIGNTYYYEEKQSNGNEWEFHFFPVFSYGESPTGHWWNVLYGLAGYTREGTKSKMRVSYIPITLSE